MNTILSMSGVEKLGQAAIVNGEQSKRSQGLHLCAGRLTAITPGRDSGQAACTTLRPLRTLTVLWLKKPMVGHPVKGSGTGYHYASKSPSFPSSARE